MSHFPRLFCEMCGIPNLFGKYRFTLVVTIILVFLAQTFYKFCELLRAQCLVLLNLVVQKFIGFPYYFRPAAFYITFVHNLRENVTVVMIYFLSHLLYCFFVWPWILQACDF